LHILQKDDAFFSDHIEQAVFALVLLVWYGQETSIMGFFPCSLTFPLYYQGKGAETRKTPVSGRFMMGNKIAAIKWRLL
jgi:hypothetical protein